MISEIKESFENFVESQRGDLTREQFIEYFLPILCVGENNLNSKEKLTVDLKLHESLVEYIIEQMKKINKIIYFENGIYFVNSANYEPSNLIGLCKNGDVFDYEKNCGQYGIIQQKIHLSSFQIETLLIIKNILVGGLFYCVDVNETKMEAEYGYLCSKILRDS